MSAPMQYTMKDGAFVRCGQTYTRLPSGFYDVKSTGLGMGLIPKDVVGDDLILMGGTVADDLVKDIEKFMDKKSLLESFGMTHKQGYLLHGPGGTGKTSLGLIVARRFLELTDGVVVFCPDAQSFYHGVAIMRDIEPGRHSLYLIEEADRIVNNTHCLSILDGELTISGAVFIAMTNYRGKLPARITNRPGRFRKVILVDAPVPEIQVEFLRRLAARNPAAMKGRSTPAQIVAGLRGVSLTMDHLREAFVSHVVFDEPIAKIKRRLQKMARDAAADEDSGNPFEGTDYWEPDDESD